MINYHTVNKQTNNSLFSMLKSENIYGGDNGAVYTGGISELENFLKSLITCIKDTNCFNEKYDCTSCCSTGLTKHGDACWESENHTPERCCKNKSEITVPGGVLPEVVIQPAGPEPTANSAQCAKDTSCFDANYECTGCCSTGKAVNGAPCWDAVYTTSRCCNQA